MTPWRKSKRNTIATLQRTGSGSCSVIFVLHKCVIQFEARTPAAAGILCYKLKKIYLDIPLIEWYNIPEEKTQNKKRKGENKMFINENGKYTSKAQFFYNDHIDMYCIIDTTLSGDLNDLTALFESADLLEEVPMPEYITENYEGSTW